MKNALFPALLATNAGVLIVLLFGPNAQRPIPALMYAGVVLALGGLFILLRAIIARRSTPPLPPTKAV